MKHRREGVSICVVAAMIVVGVGGLASAQDLSWIAKMANMSPTVTNTEGGEFEAVYSWSGDVDEVFAELKREFKDRGWILDDVVESSTGSEERTFEATQGGAEVDLILSDAMGVRTLTVHATGLSGTSGGKRAEASASAAPKAGGASGPDTDISWIGKLSGVSLMAEEREAGETEVVYSWSGDAGALMDEIVQGLKERGWTITDQVRAETGGIAAESVIEARQGGAELELVLADAMGVKTLTIEVER